MRNDIIATDHKLIGALKVHAENIKVYHRNMVGPGFLAAHDFTETIYSYLNDITDEIIEMFMVLGYIEIDLYIAVLLFDITTPHKINVNEALNYTLNHLEEIQSLIYDVKTVKQEDALPDYIISKLEEYEYELSVFIYKLNQILA